MRAAIYARFSTDLQNDRSTEDQIDLCRKFAEQNGLDVIHTFADKARSGSTTHGRTGLDALLTLGYARQFDVVVVEALDRLSRDMEDLAGIYKRMTHAGVEIRAVHEGTANTVLIGLRGLIGQLYREDNVHKVRRGMTGLVKQGLSAGGRCYGYRADPANKGKLLINEDEADVIRRVFEESAEGRSSRSIAVRLNEDGIPPPRGDRWSASTLHGSLDRGYGILHNQLYVGKIVWNKVRMVKDPDTGKRLSRANPPEQWVTQDAPEYRIVDQDLWDEVHKKKRVRQAKLADNRRPRRLLSGLLKCGCCGGGMSVTGADKSGRSRVGCSARRESGTCKDSPTFYIDVIEDLVVNSLVHQLSHPDVITTYLEEYHREREKLNKDRETTRSRIMRRMRSIEKIGTEMLMRDDAAYRLAKPEIDRLEAEYVQLEAELNELPPVANEVALHPTLMTRYRSQLSDLREALTTGMRTGDLPNSQALRDIIKTVTVHKDPETSKPYVVIEGIMNALLGVPGDGLDPSSCDVGSGRANPPIQLTDTKGLFAYGRPITFQYQAAA